MCDGRGTPLKVITTAANVNDVTQTLALVDGVPPVAGHPRPSAQATRSPARRRGLRPQPQPRRTPQAPDPARHLPQGVPNIKGIGKLRYVVEQTFALLHHFKRLAVRWERRTELHDAFVSLACSLICWRRLEKHRS
ncbi:transposase [Streptomyces lanatus]|uniref:Transposase n=1 Tax=Streptomyces lanatus TaxID=66900 RepID=A0ABV1Y7U0_9ACTN